MSDIALKIEGLTKEYRLGTIGYGTMREDLQSWWARIRGKEDPNSLITASHHSESEEKHFLALNDIYLEIKKGDRVGLIGKNGAGKSTLLKILSRITSPSKGNIYINGRIGSLLEVGTGFHQELTGRENIYLNGSILGMKKGEIDKKLDEIIDFAGIEKFIDTPVKRYSSGMFVRLGFAVAAHLEPEILIVDEVLAVGDAEFQKKAIGKMEDVSNQDGRTVLFVSHNMESVRQLCTNAVLLKQGCIASTGKVGDICDQYLSRLTNKPSTISLYDGLNKYGHGEISVQYISLENSQNGLFHVSYSEEFITISVRYHINKSVSRMWFSLAFSSSANVNLFSMPSYESIDYLEQEPGEYEVRIKFRNFFRAGSYNLNFSAVDGANTIWYSGEAVMLQINAEDNYDLDKVGFFHNNATWELM